MMLSIALMLGPALIFAAKDTERLSQELRELVEMMEQRDASSPISDNQHEEEANQDEKFDPVSRNLDPDEPIPSTYRCVNDRFYTEEGGKYPLLDQTTGRKNLEFWVTIWGMKGGSWEDWWKWCNQCGEELEGEGVICGGWHCRWFWGSIGLQRDGRSCPKCAPSVASVHTKGFWKAVESPTAETSYEVVTGVSRTMSKTEMKEWATTVTASASQSMEIGLPEIKGVSVGGSATREISGSLSQSLAETFQSSITKSTTKKRTYKYGAGVIWQWVFDVNDDCGKTEFQTVDIAHTPNKMSPPCCLPGYFKDPANARGECADGAPANAKFC